MWRASVAVPLMLAFGCARSAPVEQPTLSFCHFGRATWAGPLPYAFRGSNTLIEARDGGAGVEGRITLPFQFSLPSASGPDFALINLGFDPASSLSRIQLEDGFLLFSGPSAATGQTPETAGNYAHADMEVRLPDSSSGVTFSPYGLSVCGAPPSRARVRGELAGSDGRLDLRDANLLLTDSAGIPLLRITR